MKNYRWLIVAALLMMVIAGPSDSSAFTGKADLSWTGPTKFTDGSLLNTATDIKEYRLYCGAASGQYATATAAVISGGASTIYTLNNLGVGTTWCVITAVTTAALGSQESAWSNEASKAITAPAPGGCSTFQMK